MTNERKQGNPRTNTQRRARHTAKYGANNPLPPRGTGLRKKNK